MRASARTVSVLFAAIVLLVPAVLVLSSAPAARAAVPHVFDSVDAVASGGDSVDQTTMLAQSFVASGGYKLLSIEVFARYLGTLYMVQVELRPDAGGLPSGTPIATGAAMGSYVRYDWLQADMAPHPQLNAGTRYWIVLSCNDNPSSAYLWAWTNGANYTAGMSAAYKGSAWNLYPSQDYLFRTYGVQGPSIAAGISQDAAQVGAGDPLQYTVSFDNIGTSPASHAWVNWTPSSSVTYVSDTAASVGGVRTAQGWVFSNVDMGPHGFAINVLVSQSVFEGLPLTTSVSVDYADGAVMQERTTASVTAVARVPSLILGMSAAPDHVAPGDSLAYTVTVSNVGSRPAAWVWLNGTLPADVTYVNDTASGLPYYLDSWRSGDSLHYNFTLVPPGILSFDVNVTVNLGIRNGTRLVAWAFGNYTDAAGHIREQVKASATAYVHGASICVAQSTSTIVVQPNVTLQIIVRLDNLGDADATRVWVNDTLSPGLTRVSDTASSHPAFVNATCLASSCSWEFANVTPGPQSFILTVAVGAGLSDNVVLTSSASLMYLDSNGVPLAPSSDILGIRVSRPWYTLRVTADQFANPGDTLGYSVELANRGSGLADYVWLNVTLPPAATYVADNASESGGVRIAPCSWLFRNVTTGSVSVFLAVRLASGLADRTSVSTQFTLDFQDLAANRGLRETATATAQITAPILALHVDANRAEAARGDSLTYAVRVDNTGSGTASDVWINETIPEGTTFVRSSLQYVSTSGSEFTWHLYGVSPGPTELNVTVRIDGEVPTGTNLRSSFSVAYTDANGNDVGRQDATVDVRIVVPTFGPGLTLPITVLVLGIVVACLVGFIGWKVYGVGSKDKPRIDELFLLHRSGELVRHLTRSLRPNVDSDALSGMLVAVQDFIKESFRFVEGSLDELKFGSHRIMLAHGKLLILAAVVGGGHTERLAPILLSGLDALERDLGPALKDWDGMPSSLEGVDQALGEILKGKTANGKAPHAPRPAT